MTEILSNIDLQKLSPDKLDWWLKLNHERLIGSAIFTRQNSWTSKLVQWGEKHLFAKTKCNDDFVPSHTGSIIESHRTLYIFDMKPPRATKQPLVDYLLNTEEEYRLVMRDFGLNTDMFSFNLLFHVWERYPYLSALRSVFSKRQSKWRRHCSEMHIRELQKQELFTDINPEITPEELYHVLKGDKK